MSTVAYVEHPEGLEASRKVAFFWSSCPLQCDNIQFFLYWYQCWKILLSSKCEDQDTVCVGRAVLSFLNFSLYYVLLWLKNYCSYISGLHRNCSENFLIFSSIICLIIILRLSLHYFTKEYNNISESCQLTLVILKFIHKPDTVGPAVVWHYICLYFLMWQLWCLCLPCISLWLLE